MHCIVHNLLFCITSSKGQNEATGHQQHDSCSMFYHFHLVSYRTKICHGQDMIEMCVRLFIATKINPFYDMFNGQITGWV